MSRYTPTVEEKAAIDLLNLAGYAVVRQGTYDNLRKRIDQLEWEVQWCKRDRENSRAWAIRCSDEEQRVSRRLTEVAAAAASEGVSIFAINAALHRDDHTPAPTTESDDGGMG